MVNRTQIASVRNSNYEFSHWDKADVSFETGVLRLFKEDGLSNSPWSTIFAAFLSSIWVRLQGPYQLYLFFCSPVWMANTKINRHYGLWKKLSKEHPTILELDVVSESSHESGAKIRFSGIARIHPQDIEGLLYLLFSHRVGLIFAIENANDEIMTNIESLLFDQAVEQPDAKMEHMINVPTAINTIVDSSGIVIYPNGSEEFGGVYLDLFAKIGMIKKLS